MAIASVETNMQLQVWQMTTEFTETEIDILPLAQYVNEDELE